ncbi:MAG: DUF503 domain-containing protein [Armatimonadetes bacterium]|nr:DUF503 domain-containing protein [Armatimonadota bacterium]
MEPYVGLLTVDLLVPEATTLKDKRQVVRSILDRAAARYNVSVAEIDHLENPQRASLAFACVANETARVRHVLGLVLQLVEDELRAEVLQSSVEIL